MQTATRDALTETATALVRRRGYAGFSYADLSEVVGIRKASIHHHFPTKEDLGAAIVQSYGERFAERLAEIWDENDRAIARLDAYAGLYRAGLATGQGCLCGVLAAEIAVLPPRVRDGVTSFFEANLRWLEQVIREGMARGQLRAGLGPHRDARMVLSALQGSMFVALALGAPKAFDDAVAGLKAGLRPRPA